jgi:hypothetical protein
MGKKIIILTVDSRPRDNVGELLAGDPLKFATASPSAFGALNHYLYGNTQLSPSLWIFRVSFVANPVHSTALIHGYAYRYVRAPEFADRYGTWVKVPIVKEALLTHDVAVFMDGDVGVHYPHVPLEWLMNHWNITDQTLIAAPLDVHQFDNFNDRGELSLNTGFLLGQASPRAQELFQEWVDCPTEPNEFYKGCSEWAYNWAHEQAALRDYIRHKYDRPEDIVTIPCPEANGSPDHPDGSQPGGEGSNCTGQFIRHYWMDKDLMKRELIDSIMPYMVSRLHESLTQGGPQSGIVDGHEKELGKIFNDLRRS